MLLFFIRSWVSGQVFNPSEQKNSAHENIEKLKNGTLIVPIWVREKKRAALEDMLKEEGISDKSRRILNKKLVEQEDFQQKFNRALVNAFIETYNFSKVLFVLDHQLHDFDPDKCIFLDPESLNPDPHIQFGGGDIYFLRYYQASGIATAPQDVRFLRIANKNFDLLVKPFPSSPDRKTSYRLRFRDLINLSPEIKDLVNILVTKLNDNLVRYQGR